MSRNLERDAARASRQHAILDALHLSKFVGEPHANDREDEAKREPKSVNAPASLMIVIVLAGQKRELQSRRPLGHGSCAGRGKSCVARSK